jgi:hypothetical protein
VARPSELGDAYISSCGSRSDRRQLARARSVPCSWDRTCGWPAIMSEATGPTFATAAGARGERKSSLDSLCDTSAPIINCGRTYITCT